MCFNNRVLGPKTSTSLQTSAAEAHLAEGAIFSNRTDIEHRKVSDISNRDPKASNFQSRRAKYRTTINLSKEECINNNNNNNKPITITGCLQMLIPNSLLDTAIFTHKEIEQNKQT
jgi:hypothetical protein